MEIEEKPAHFIKEWRKFRNMTQKQVADKMPFTNGALSQLETHRTSYRQDMLEALAVALECEPSDLLRKPNPEDIEWANFNEEQKRLALQLLKMWVSTRDVFAVGDTEPPVPNGN